MSTHVDVHRLERELVLRSLDGRSLARLAKVSEATVSHLRTGRGIRSATLRRIAIALLDTPVVEGVERLLPEGSSSIRPEVSTPPG